MSGRPMPDNSADNPDGDNAPGYSHKRPAYEPDKQRVKRPTGKVVPYAELHCHSNFSFLDGVSDPEELIEESVRTRTGRAGDHRSRRLLRRFSVRGGSSRVRSAHHLWR